MDPFWQTNRLMTMRPPEDPKASQPVLAGAPGAEPTTAASGANEPPGRPAPPQAQTPATMPREIGGREGPEPTRFGDWEKAGRCIDF